MASTAITVKQYLKLWVATIISAHTKKPIHRCENKILKGEMRSDKWMSSDEIIYKKEVTKFRNCGSVIGGSSIWEQHSKITFKDILRWYNNKDVVPTLEAKQKMIEFYHDKGLEMLKLGCTLPNLARLYIRKRLQNSGNVGV